MGFSIKYRVDPSDPPWLLMVGDSPMAKEFTKREEDIFKSGRIIELNTAEKISNHTSLIIESILTDDYNRRHSERKKRKEAGVETVKRHGKITGIGETKT